MLLRPGTTVLARSLSHGTEIEAVLEGRNGCRPGEHLAIIDPGNLLPAGDAGGRVTSSGGATGHNARRENADRR